MTDEITPDAGNAMPESTPKFKIKRDIFRFNGEKDTTVNLEHVTMMQREGKRLTFFFYNNSIYFDLADDEVATRCYEQLLAVWGGDVVA